MIKQEIIKQLKKLGIEFNPKAKKEELDTLLETPEVKPQTDGQVKYKNKRLAKKKKNVV